MAQQPVFKFTVGPCREQDCPECGNTCHCGLCDDTGRPSHLVVTLNDVEPGNCFGLEGVGQVLPYVGDETTQCAYSLNLGLVGTVAVTLLAQIGYDSIAGVAWYDVKMVDTATGLIVYYWWYDEDAVPARSVDCGAIWRVLPLVQQTGNLCGAIGSSGPTVTISSNGVQVPNIDLDDCCCPPDCTITGERFSRPDAADPGPPWVVYAGSWPIVGQKVQTADSDAVMASSNVGATGTDAKLWVRVRASAAGDVLRALAGVANADNYVYAEWQAGAAGYLALGQRQGGVDAELIRRTVATDLDRWYLLALCLDGNELVARLSGGSLGSSISIESALVGTPSGDELGLGTGTITGLAQFDDFISSDVSDTCESCSDLLPPGSAATSTCGTCCQGAGAAAEYDVDLGAGGWLNDDCNQCSAVLGVFTVALIGTSTTGCRWDYQQAAWCTFSCGGFGFGPALHIRLERRRDEDGCYWYLAVLLIQMSQGPDDLATPGIASAAYYESAREAADSACSPGPFSLSKTSENHGAAGACRLCTGALPATVQIEAV